MPGRTTESDGGSGSLDLVNSLTCRPTGGGGGGPETARPLMKTAERPPIFTVYCSNTFPSLGTIVNPKIALPVKSSLPILELPSLSVCFVKS